MYVRVLILVVFINVCKCQDGNGFFGTVELVKHSRRSRLLSDFVDGSGSAAVPSHFKPMPPVQAQRSAPPVYSAPPAEAVRGPRQQSTERMLKNYGNIFQMDTKNLTDKQRVLLERIVERVARLGGSLEPENEIQDDGSNGNESRSRQRNRNVRKNAVKVAPAAPASTSASSSSVDPIATTKTVMRTTAGVISHPTKPVSSSTTKVGKSKVTQVSNLHQLRPNSTEVVLGNITTSSIVDSLSKDNAREDVYGRRPALNEKVKVSTIPIKC